MFLQNDQNALPVFPNLTMEELKETNSFTFQEAGVRIRKGIGEDKGIRTETNQDFQKLKMFDKKVIPISLDKIKNGTKLLTPKGHGIVETIKGQIITLTNKNKEKFSANTNEVTDMINLDILTYNDGIPAYITITMNIHRTLQDIIIKLSNILNVKPSGFLFFGKEKLNVKKTIVQNNLPNGAKLIFERSGSGEFKRFQRFKTLSDDQWYTSNMMYLYIIYIYIYIIIGNSSWDAITYIALVPMTIVGFACFAPCNTTTPVNYNFKIQLNSKSLREKTIKVQKKGESKIIDIMFSDDEAFEVDANTRITFIQAIDCDKTFKGNGCEHQEVKENEKEVFKVESSSEDHNCTCTDYGQLPQIFYCQ